MKIDQIRLIADSLGTLHYEAGDHNLAPEDIAETIDALIGILWDEEDAGRIKDYMRKT